MGTKIKIKIQLTQKDEALVHYEMEFGKMKRSKSRHEFYIMTVREQVQLPNYVKRQEIVTGRSNVC